MEEKTFLQNIKVIKNFVSPAQLQGLGDLYRSPEKSAALEIAGRLAGIINKMPETYGTEDIATQLKTLQLHYFNSSSDWYIIEKDKGSEGDEEKGLQHQAFGYAILNQDEINAEWGYISIVELLKFGVELDFYFNTTQFKDLSK